MLFNFKHRLQFTNKIIFGRAIEKLKLLQEVGIFITINGEQKQIYFMLVTVSGDNLGIHSIPGLVESFSANLFCRVCLTENKNFHSIFNERDCVLRNKENYETLLSANKVSIAGMKETCILNQIEEFHIPVRRLE